MGKRPADPFYWNDWERDMKHHPLEINGAWILICCKLAFAKTYGEDTKSLDEWRRVLSESPKECIRILQYLKDKEIGDVDIPPHPRLHDPVKVVCRRMVRDARQRRLFADRQSRWRTQGTNGPEQGRVDGSVDGSVDGDVDGSVDDSVTPMSQRSSISSSVSSSEKEKNKSLRDLEKKKKANGDARVGKHKLPDDFTLTDDLRAYAVKKGLDPDETFEHFCDHHRGLGTKWERWDLAFKNWCRIGVEKKQRHHGRSKGWIGE